MIEPATTVDATFVRRGPLNSDGPTTLVEIYERVVRDHPKTDTLNYKREGA